MHDFTVERRGTDTSGRPIYATQFMWDWWLSVVDRLGFTPTVVQGAFMSRVPGGGADASAGYHDLGGCFDLRVWDLTEDQQGKVVRELRRSAAAAWLRDEQHGGMDPHIHFVFGSDSPLASGASYQWLAYIAGGDGMGGDDYHWRPDPLVTTPPPTKDWFDMASEADLRRIVREEIAAAAKTIKVENPTDGERKLWTLEAILQRTFKRAGE